MLGGCAQQTRDSQTEQEVLDNNRGVALMGRFEYQAAIDVFSELVEQNPEWQAARVNLAIALKNRQGEGDGDLALSQLGTVLEAEPANVLANYNSGVLNLYVGKVEPAAEYFTKALAVDSSDAYAHYYLGQCQLRLGDPEAALKSYQKAVELDPYLRSAYYSAAQVLRRLGKSEEANQQLKMFQRMENNPAARLAEFKYTRMGPKSIAQVVGETNPEFATIVPEGELFAAPTVLAALDDLAGSASASSVDIDHDGAQDIYVWDQRGNTRLLKGNATGEYQALANAPFQDIENVTAVAWGDLDHNGLVDAYLCRDGVNQLWFQRELGEWEQDGADTGSADGNKNCSDAAMVDADHDGDLDILVTNIDAANDLLNNNRDGTFKSLSPNLAGNSDQQATQFFLATDLDADNDVDLIFIRASDAHTVLINDRLWSYQTSKQFQEFESSDVQALVAVDIDADAQMELVGWAEDGSLLLWQQQGNGVWQPEKIYQSVLKAKQQRNISAQDVSGNGQAELLLRTDQGFEVVALSATGAAEQLHLEEAVNLQLMPMVSSLNGASLIAIQAQGEGVEISEWPAGEGRFAFVTMSFTGKHDAAETMRSNMSGIGTQVGVRFGSRWARANTHKNSSLRGYNLQPLAIGLNGQDAADFVEIEWSDGVYQTELDVPVKNSVTIAEEQRQLGSCPVLFAWNGEKFDFVTDILGVGAQGFLVEPGTIMPPRPWEYVPFGPGMLKPADGRFKFKLTEPMEENSYIDSMHLTAYDVPQGWDLIVDERMATGAPEVTGEVFFYQTSLSPAAALNSKGLDVLGEVKNQDQVAMPLDDIDARYIGLLEDVETLELQFEQALDHNDGMPILAAESWVELPYSQTHFAAWQAGKTFRSVSLEAKSAQGEWQMVYPEFGIPAGMPRTMALPLQDLPAGTTGLRLSWNRQIYWDRIRVVFADTPPEKIITRELSPKLATVAKSGFSKRVNHPQRRPEYLYQQRTPFGDVKYPTGMYTNIGEMTELIDAADDALAIIGPGEEIHVEFDAPENPAPEMQRWYVLETKGWAKDKDMYTATGSFVEPLPRAHPDADPALRMELHQQYNTRFQSGR